MANHFKRKNPNTKQFDQKKLRSDGDRLSKFLPLFEKAGSVLDFGGGLEEIPENCIDILRSISLRGPIPGDQAFLVPPIITWRNA